MTPARPDMEGRFGSSHLGRRRLRRPGFALALTFLLACGDSIATADAPLGGRSRAEQRADELASRFDVERIAPGGVEIVTAYSRVLLRDEGGRRRAMFFLRDGEYRMLQTRLDLGRPDRLFSGYTKALFATYLFQPAPERALLLGLGGGAMVRFLQARAPALVLDAVDIDPLVVDIAQRYFGVRPSETVRLHTADAYDFVRRSSEAWDAIHVDVFLQPTAETDAAGGPRRMKEAPFYAALSEHLRAGGAISFNLLPHPGRDSDVEVLRSSFPQVYVFGVSGELNWVAVATRDPERVEVAELRRRAAALDRRFGGTLSLADTVALLDPRG